MANSWRPIESGMTLRSALRLAWLGLLPLAAGCLPAYPHTPTAMLAGRILDPRPPAQPAVEQVPPPAPASATSPDPAAQAERPPDRVAPAAFSAVPPALGTTTASATTAPEPLPAPSSVVAEPIMSGSPAPERFPEEDRPLTLSAAIDLAYRNSPALRTLRARVDVAESGKNIAYSDFLPTLDVGYRVIGGATDPHGYSLPTLPTAVGNVAFGGPAEQFNVAELRAQWTLWDFGRTSGRFGQALLAEDIARLQFVRGAQSVAFDVATAYFETLAAHASVVVAEEAVRRAESVLRDARNMLRQGDAINNDVLRADVLLAEMKLELVTAVTAERVATAKLNRAMGRHPNLSTRVADAAAPPSFDLPLAQCLQLAVENRREFAALERGIAQAKLGEGVAQAQFMPRVYVGGVAVHQDEHSPDRASQHASGGLNVELGLFQGGRRIEELRGANAEVALAVARGQEVCDQIAFEVAVSWLDIADARQRITVAQAAAAQASENLRVVRSMLDAGDATPTELIDAELTLTRAQQRSFTAIYDYQEALARLSYGVGLTPERFLASPPLR